MTHEGSSEELTKLLQWKGKPGLLSQEQHWFESVLVWVLQPDRMIRWSGTGRSARLRLLGRVLDAHPDRAALLARMDDVWRDASAVRLLAEMGLPDQTSFLGEVVQRIADRLLPTLDAGEDLYALVDRLGLGESDARWLETLEPTLVARWAGIFAPGSHAFADAAQLLGYRTASLGLARDLLLYQPAKSDLESPFFALPLALRAWAKAPQDLVARDAWMQSRAACRVTIRAIHLELDRRGVSSDVVFRLDLAKASLARIDVLLALNAGEGDGHSLALELVRGSASQHSLRQLLRATLRRLARKVVEHTAQTGEHYIANSPREWLAMLASAAGGGALTAFTAFFKYLLAALPLAPAMLGAAHAVDYSASFISMQFLGFSLASKQPAMTGAALADALEQENGLAAEVDLVASISRTQFIAAVGNVCLAIPMALLVDLAMRVLRGHSLLGPEHAASGLLGLHPFRSWTLPFAALTGVFLWLSSLAAGWGANWSTFRSLPKAVARSRRVCTVLGEIRARRLGVLVERHLSGVIGYLVLGFLLGFVPVLCQFAGLGIEVRHVTLSSASLAFDASALFTAGRLEVGPLLWAALGIVLIGVLNFGVSFGLSLRVALQARDIIREDRGQLVRGLLRAFASRPLRFLVPPTKTASLADAAQTNQDDGATRSK